MDADLGTTVDRLHSYPKVYNLGHPAIADLFDGPVVVQEKVDGSQFTFGVLGGELHLRSKGATIHGVEAADKLFRGAAETAARLADRGHLIDGWQYRGEALCGPKHNTLEYGRAPEGNFILFDVDMGRELRVLDPHGLQEIADALGLECVPLLHVGDVTDLDYLRSFLERESVLGGCKVEGIVIKNYARWGKDGKQLMGKIVSEAFREKHSASWAKANPTKGDVVERTRELYRTEARWQKAVQHLAEDGALEHAPKDIGALIQEVQADVLGECREEIAGALFDAFWPQIRRGITAGLPEWYKARLAERQFTQEDE